MPYKFSSFEITKEDNRIVFDLKKGKQEVKLSLNKKDAKTIADEILRLINKN